MSAYALARLPLIWRFLGEDFSIVITRRRRIRWERGRAYVLH